MSNTRTELIAVDVGNSRMKLGRFAGEAADSPLPLPVSTLEVEHGEAEFERIGDWLADARGPQGAAWWIGSVNRPATTRLLEWLQSRDAEASVTLLTDRDLPIQVAVARPDRVGIDRLLDAVAANRLRQSGSPAVVVDLGTAITVDLVTAEGVFAGGAILPGMGTAVRALHRFTDLLPLVELVAAPLPSALGGSTVEAIASGVFWGAVGGIREVASRLSQGLAGATQMFVTGAAAADVTPHLGPHAQCVPHLTLAGIAVTARH